MLFFVVGLWAYCLDKIFGTVEFFVFGIMVCLRCLGFVIAIFDLMGVQMDYFWFYKTHVVYVAA